mmetsp:Transcript_1492/g.3283  ORF Transcript_1492/g.3283 Transcript_1492/m.3283 type:complete len:96 (+) Transcript_1492:185-472(+)
MGCVCAAATAMYMFSRHSIQSPRFRMNISRHNLSKVLPHSLTLKDPTFQGATLGLGETRGKEALAVCHWQLEQQAVDRTLDAEAAAALGVVPPSL